MSPPNSPSAVRKRFWRLLARLHMPGEPIDDLNKTRNQETVEKKQVFLAYLHALPVKKAAAEPFNGSPDAIDHWLREDQGFPCARHFVISPGSWPDSHDQDCSNEGRTRA